MRTDDIEILRQVHQREYANAVCDWLIDIITTDADGDWYAFAVNGESGDGLTMPTGLPLRRCVIRASELATSIITRRATSNPRRQAAKHAVGAFYIVGEVNDGCHLHGFLRVPRLDTTRVPLLCVSTRHERLVPTAPWSLQVFSTALSRSLDTRNIWWKTTKTGRFAEVLNERDNGFAAPNYCRRSWKHEKRIWEDCEFQPAYAFSRRFRLVTRKDT